MFNVQSSHTNLVTEAVSVYLVVRKTISLLPCSVEYWVKLLPETLLSSALLTGTHLMFCDVWGDFGGFETNLMRIPVPLCFYV